MEPQWRKCYQPGPLQSGTTIAIWQRTTPTPLVPAFHLRPRLLYRLWSKDPAGHPGGYRTTQLERSAGADRDRCCRVEEILRLPRIDRLTIGMQCIFEKHTTI